MKIIADENMPYVQELFAALGEVVLVDGRHLSPEQVADADVLLVRSVTAVNKELLSENRALQFVGTATIGTDHIDLDYLTERNISFSSAPGCNATAVGEYAFTAMLELARRTNSQLKNKTVGIIGAGNTGSALAKCLRGFGIKVLLNDPLLQAQGDSRDFVSLDQVISEADIISLHVPLTKLGVHKTWYLFDEARLNGLKPGAWLLNCCRGEVINNRALIEFKQQREDVRLVLDVWEGEPSPMDELVPLVDIATPHIAGYSLEGKARGTLMLYEQLCRTLSVPVDKSLAELLPSYHLQSVSLASEINQMQLTSLVRSVYDIRDDDELFRISYSVPGGFDQMRKNHRHRREFSALTLVNRGQCDVNWLFNIGFSGVGQ
ncbi:4-phosphoerythronate dehydrogenase PdxB [Shewanella gelidii]|uniref:Erythronate-4-phosphate dehydrogenase n=1 Tax=Shewanella gelidii TaxID=1642821 RepID=A0A917JRK9_9GAMM|nr:4-phosphoerythronate dehydrogenase PdxB [Shewanella gelidii]MCL1098237.1 4-phosphoerythronate dehydrogenase PdxB [Shewanella gelidii]GGI83636.1 erythronate-4-phosphate dehydrogenase [Shewanella gelidii]